MVHRPGVHPSWQPFWDGLKAAVIWPDGPTDLITGQTFTLEEGTYGTTIVADGEGLNVDAADTTYTLPSEQFEVLPGCAIAAGVYLVDTPTSPSMFWGMTHNNTDASPYQSLSLGVTSTGKYAFFRNNGATLQTIEFDPGRSPQTGEMVTMIAVVEHDGTERAWFFSDQQTPSDNSSSAADHIDYAATAELVIGSQPGTSGRDSNAIFRFGYIWGRPLSEGEVRRLAADPYGPVRPSSWPNFPALATAQDPGVYIDFAAGDVSVYAEF